MALIENNDDFQKINSFYKNFPDGLIDLVTKLMNEYRSKTIENESLKLNYNDLNLQIISQKNLLKTLSEVVFKLKEENPVHFFLKII